MDLARIVFRLSIILAVFMAPTLRGYAMQGKPKLVRKPIQEAESEKIPGDVPAQAEFNPSKAKKNVDVGRFYFKRGKLAAAMSRFRDALLYKPNYPDAYRWLARCYEKQKNYPGALAVIVEFEQKYPDSPALKKLQKVKRRLAQKIEHP